MKQVYTVLQVHDLGVFTFKQGEFDLFESRFSQARARIARKYKWLSRQPDPAEVHLPVPIDVLEGFDRSPASDIVVKNVSRLFRTAPKQ